MLHPAIRPQIKMGEGKPFKIMENQGKQREREDFFLAGKKKLVEIGKNEKYDNKEKSGRAGKKNDGINSPRTFQLLS